MPADNQSFVDKLTRAIERNQSLLCVGLDPDPEKFSTHFPETIDARTLFEWGKNIIGQTADLVCCYKPNSAFYEQHGTEGLEALRQTIAAVPEHIPVLLDAKRGDIDSTAGAYAHAAFEVWGADAITLSPYLGQDSIAPFLAHKGKTAFILCYTSNPSAREIQEFGFTKMLLFEHIVRQSQRWGSEAQIGYVVGATQPHALARVRELLGDSTHWILAPGIGAQGGNLQEALTAGLDSSGSGLIVPVSRAVIYADSPRQAALSLRNEINRARKEINTTLMITFRRELILKLHQVGCIQFGNFTLASGKQSPIYIDLRRIAANPALLQLAGRAYAKLIRALEFDHLAAVPYAALTIGTAAALETNNSLIYPRKEIKSHGTGKNIEGVFAAGDKVVMIEDLVTSGGSVLKAIAQLEAAQLNITDVAVLIDREQGGREALAEKGYTLHAALKISEVLDVLQKAGKISTQDAESVRNYLRG